MSDIASIGYGTAVAFGSGFLAEIVDVKTDQSRDSVETTHMASPDQHKEFIPGLIDAGQLSVTINYDPSTEPPYNDPESITITYPDGSTSACDGFLISNSEAIPVGDKMSQDVTIKRTGKPVHTPAA